MHIVLVEPEIPSNTGNIARTCVLTGSTLHLVEPLGFSLDDRHLKRAGLDYWEYLDFHVYHNFLELKKNYYSGRFFYFTTRAKKLYTEVEYDEEDFLVFGKETEGLPKDIIEKEPQNCLRIPMKKESKRSLNLGNAAAIALYESLRKLNFAGLE